MNRKQRYIGALEQSTIGGDWTTREAHGPDPSDTPFELARVSVPPALSQGWVVTWSPPPWSQWQGQIPEPPAGRVLEPQHIGDTYLIVKWGNGGVFAVAEIDWGQGGSVNVFGSDVQVSVFHPSPKEYVNPGEALTDLNAWISPGQSRDPVPVTRTVNLAPIAAASRSVPYAVPRFAKKAHVYIEEFDVVRCYLEFGNRSFTHHVGCYVWDTTPNRNYNAGEQYAPVPRSATDFCVRNNHTVEKDYYVVFELCI